mmetsp:Transcript_13769/g.41513  ORF Transcript_13769/g.41513 Transcript_13769/m.41513 type:complete len:904 (-) Transcript_13769:94-2805(-)
MAGMAPLPLDQLNPEQMQILAAMQHFHETGTEPPMELQIAFQEVIGPLMMQQPTPEMMEAMQAQQQISAGASTGLGLTPGVVPEGALFEDVLDADSGEAVQGKSSGEDHIFLGTGALPLDQLPEGALFGGHTLSETQAALQDSLKVYRGALFSMKHPAEWSSSVEESSTAEVGARVETVCFRPESRADGQSLLVVVRELEEPVSAEAVALKHRKDWSAVHESFRLVSDSAVPVGGAQNVASFRAGVLIDGEMTGVQHWVGVLDGKWLLDVQEKITDPQRTIANPLMHQLSVEACVASLSVHAEQEVAAEQDLVEDVLDEAEEVEDALIAAEETEELEDVLAEAQEVEDVLAEAQEVEDESPVDATQADVHATEEQAEEHEHQLVADEKGDTDADADANVEKAASISSPAELAAADEVSGADDTATSANDDSASQQGAVSTSAEQDKATAEEVDDVDQASAATSSDTQATQKHHLVLPYDIEINPADPHVVTLTFHSLPGIASLRDLKNNGVFALDDRTVHIAFRDPESGATQSVLEGTLFGTYDSFQVEYRAASGSFALTFDDVSPPSNQWAGKPVIVSPRVENDLNTIDPTSLALLAMGLKRAGDEEVAWEYLRKSADCGSPIAQIALAQKLESENKHAEAFAYWLLLTHAPASLGGATAAYKVAKCYADGVGTPKDQNMWVQYIQHAASLYHPDAIYEMAKMHLTGTGLPQNSQRAMTLMRAATNFGSTQALVFLGRAYLGLEELPEDAILEGGRHNVSKASQCFAQAHYIDPSITPPPELEEQQKEMVRAKKEEIAARRVAQTRASASSAAASSSSSRSQSRAGSATGSSSSASSSSSSSSASSSAHRHAPASFGQTLTADPIRRQSTWWDYAGPATMGLLVAAFTTHFFLQRKLPFFQH